MAETNRVSYDVLESIDAPFVSHEAATAKIGADPAKGIPDSVEVSFTGVTFAVSNGTEASEAFETLGADVFNGLLNYAADLKLRARAVQAERARLTTDPFKKEAKSVALLIGEENVEAYLALRRDGKSQREAIAALVA